MEARDVLIHLQEATAWVCSKRLRPTLPVLLPDLERHDGAGPPGQD